MSLRKNTFIKFAVTLSLCLVLFFDAFAAEQEELESENEEYENAISEQKEELEGVLDEIDEIEKTVESLEANISEIEESLENLESQLADIQSEIDELSETVAEEEAEIAELYDTMCLRIQYFYENYTEESIMAILEAGSISDFLSEAEFSSELVSYDREQIEKIYVTVEDVEVQKDALEEEYASLEALKAEYEAQTALLEATKEEKEQYLAEAYAEEYELEDSIAALQAEYEKNSVAIDAIVAGYSESVVADLTSMIWPLPSDYGLGRITSYFGYRSKASTYGVGSTYHKGIDVSAPSGTEIYAVLDGTVVMSEYNSSCGYYVVIYHGGGLYSHYYHQCKASPLSVGDKVSQGDIIGYVGSTGASTGNHLHFALTTEDIWEGYIDPLPYLKIALNDD